MGLNNTAAVINNKKNVGGWVLRSTQAKYPRKATQHVIFGPLYECMRGKVCFSPLILLATLFQNALFFFKFHTVSGKLFQNRQIDTGLNGDLYAFFFYFSLEQQTRKNSQWQSH